MPVAEIDAQKVGQKLSVFRYVVEFRYQFFKIGHVVEAVLEGICYRIEHSIRMIEATALQTQYVVRIETCQIVENETGRRIV